MSEKHSISSPSLERADMLNGQGNASDEHDVFGHEEEHDVRILTLIHRSSCPRISVLHSTFISCKSRVLTNCSSTSKDQIQDAVMGARCRSYDSRDREQWHAQLTFVTGSRGSGARGCSHCLPWSIRTLHCVDLDPVQTKTSRRYRQYNSSTIFILSWLIYVQCMR